MAKKPKEGVDCVDMNETVDKTVEDPFVKSTDGEETV